MKKASHLVSELKEAGEDFEWYPTTKEMISHIRRFVGEGNSVLDIGAGRGDVLNGLADKVGALYAIEKSSVLINEIKASVFIIGTDFHRQTLIDKRVDTIFCNPPYSEYDRWASRIIREANCDRVIMIIPKRWKTNGQILDALTARKVTATVRESFTFNSAERRARAEVDLLTIDFSNPHSLIKKKHDVDPFELWFEETFSAEISTANAEDNSRSSSDLSEEIENEIVHGRSFIPRLVFLYDAELKTLIDVYRKIACMNSSLLKELGIERETVIGALKQKIDGLKNKYWKELFDNLTKITTRLTFKSRESLLNTITKYTAVDFSVENIYAVVIWAIKNANKYLDNQMVDTFLEIADLEGCTPYKSNTHWHKDSWKFSQQKRQYRRDKDCYNDEGDCGPFRLDYRFIKSFYNLLHKKGEFREYEYRRFNGLHDCAGEVLADVITVACNLGFKMNDSISSHFYERGVEYPLLAELNDKTVELMRLRPYQNGNCHIKLNQDFLMRWNVEVSRILGWVRSPKEASDEMGYPIEKVQAIYNSSYRIEANSLGLLPDPDKQKENACPFA